MALDASLLNSQHYKVRIKGKWNNLREGVAPSPTSRCCNHCKEELSSRPHQITNIYIYICMYIYIYIHPIKLNAIFSKQWLCSNGCTTLTLTKSIEKRFDGNSTKMWLVILNKSSKKYPSKQQLYDHLSAISKTIQIRQTKHAEHGWRSKDKLISDVLLWTPSHRRSARTYLQQLCKDTGLRM